jgi:hypothetical protein
VTEADRRQLCSAVRNAARKVARNPRADQPDLAGQLERAGLTYLDQYTEQINERLGAGESAYSIARTFYGVVIAYMLAWRKADNAAYWAAKAAA